MNTKNITRREFGKAVAVTGSLAALSSSGSAAAQSTAAPITVALVGCAHIHTPGFVKLMGARPDVKVKYVWDHDPARAKKRASELQTAVATDLGQIWSDRAVTGVVICSETNRHLELVSAAAKAGKHMFVEKPLGITARDSYAMASAIEGANLVFTTGYFQRTHPHHLFLKDEIAKGSFGKITRVVGSNCHAGSLGKWFDTEWRWMADPKVAGVGGFGDLGTHSLDILMWLMGPVETATADIKVVTGHYGECDESGQGLLKFKNGASGTLSAGWVDVADPVTLIVSGTQAHAAVINGELFYTNSKIEGADGKKRWTQLPKGLPPPLDMFLDRVGGVKDLPMVPVREAADRVAVMEAMYKGARERKWFAPESQ